MERFDPGLDIRWTLSPLGFEYGPDCFGPDVEVRRLDAIRGSLRDPDCTGPDPVYAIAMDIGKPRHRQALVQRSLLVGAVIFAPGALGEEPVRSQGHVHAISASSGSSTPELYEIWAGRAVIYMQERVTDDPGRCFAVHCGPGERVLVPPGWAHATINADPAQPMVFGAFCVRDYGFDYDDVRRHHGLAFYPLLREGGLIWLPNSSYRPSQLIEKKPGRYVPFGIRPDAALYHQFEDDFNRMRFVSKPQPYAEAFRDFIP